ARQRKKKVVAASFLCLCLLSCGYRPVLACSLRGSVTLFLWYWDTFLPTPLPSFSARRRTTLADLSCLPFGFGSVPAKQSGSLEVIFHEIKPSLDIVGVQLHGLFQVGFHFTG